MSEPAQLPSPPPSVEDNIPSSRVSTEVGHYERKMGDSEVSYYLPSRATGVNDMYLHLGFKAPAHLVTPARIRTVWAILRLKHPLLASQVQMHDYADIRFVYHAPRSPEDASKQAGKTIEYRSQSKDELIDSYLNGDRILSNDCASYLILSGQTSSSLTPPITPNHPAKESTDEQSIEQNYDILICAAHYIGDGMALHQFAHDFFTLLGSETSESELEVTLGEQWKEIWGNDVATDAIIPCSLEESLPSRGGRFRRAAAKVDFDNSQRKFIGGHSFPRESGKIRHTIVPTISFDEGKTKVMLKACKAHGVSISVALFAICNIVWSRMRPNNTELPMMMYSALNLRPYMPKPPPSYWFLAVGYFNVILPSFISNTLPASATFWHRARLSKEQSIKAAKNSMVVSRAHEMSKERGIRARAWGKEDDEKANGTWVAPPRSPPEASSKPPNNALIGLSLLGNLDGIYKHQDFKSIKMHTLTTGSRQRNGGMLLFVYTFVGKLWLSLGYDEEGFEKETATTFWKGVEEAVDEFLLQDKA